MVHFDQCSGPTFEDMPFVPIFVSRREFDRDGMSCVQRQFPISAAYAITVHKTQGITLDECVLNIADREFAPGLRYAATSRVKSHGLLFEQPFDFGQIRRRPSNLVRMRQDDIQRRAGQTYPSSGRYLAPQFGTICCPRLSWKSDSWLRVS